VCVLLTTLRWAPPLQDDSSLSALTGIGLQCVTQTLISVGPAGTEVVHTGSVPRLRRHHAMAGLKGSGLQGLTASVSPLLGLVACVFTGVNVLTGATGWERTATIHDLKWQAGLWLACNKNTISLLLWVFCVVLCIYFTLQLFPKSASDRLSCPLGVRRSSW